jgi:hypothetical protein
MKSGFFRVFQFSPQQKEVVKRQTSNASTMPSPVGLPLDTKGRWTVGKLLDSGVQGAVHVVLEHSKTNGAEHHESEYVVKLAPFPVAKPTKKQTSPAERNAASIYVESGMYRIQFPQLQGKILPKLPPFGALPCYGEKGGTLNVESPRSREECLPPWMGARASS